jgi:Bardet-Biedl syndrome 5 protein
MPAQVTQQEPCWHYREIRFDLPPTGIALHRGEKMIDSINSVEDTKGNNGERGSLEITNLRVIWTSHKNSRTNLSERNMHAIVASI